MSQGFEISLKFVPLVSKIVFFDSAFAAGVFCGIKKKKTGYLYGALTGLVYSLILLIVSFAVNENFAFNLMTVLTIILAIFTSALGGIIGINIRVKKKRKRAGRSARHSEYERCCTIFTTPP